MGQGEGISPENEVTRSSWVGTTNRGSYSYASEELKRLLGSVRVAKLTDGDVFRWDASVSEEETLEAIRRKPPIFLRHVFPVQLEAAAAGTADDLLRIQELVRNAGWGELNRKRVAVQARKAEGFKTAYCMLDVKQAIDDVLSSVYSAEPSVKEMDYVISVFLTSDAALIGCSTPEESLSSWSGGAVHFRKEDGDISRAKFKLMEAEQVFGIDFSSFRTAIDVGAAPGGWSSFLLERGLAVTAIDPAAMHPSLLANRSLKHLRVNASEARLPEGSADLLVCDMSWEPRRMAQLVKALLPAVASGGTVVTTVKLMHGKPFATLRTIEETFVPLLKLAGARQLFHNREELTCLWVKQ
ncbi:SAM-dependent methyltransferase [Paenibacillus thermotolerans]|uniref:SAM-dependent methyltransferase n=1 Tax=Paenibacillus thermotolerans TaxID=3027807 RepID=UPI0023676B49|nr:MULTISPECIES: SAM-dependent methyltransferase [unclassified Paenibacillus]